MTKRSQESHPQATTPSMEDIHVSSIATPEPPAMTDRPLTEVERQEKVVSELDEDFQFPLLMATSSEVQDPSNTAPAGPE